VFEPLKIRRKGKKSEKLEFSLPMIFPSPSKALERRKSKKNPPIHQLLPIHVGVFNGPNSDWTEDQISEK